MKKFFYLLTLVLACVACEDEETPPATGPDNFWANTHSAFMGLKGEVSRVTETSYQPATDSEDREIMESRFDASGRLLYYNPTGIEPAPQTRWVGVASAYYHYQYDASGLLTEATVDEVGAETCTYTLTYGTHDCYVPLIFPMGPMDFFLVKGLQSIRSSDGEIDYQFKNNRATYSRSSWGSVTETVYEYAEGALYPARRLITRSRNGEVLDKETTVFTFGMDGHLSSSESELIDGEGEKLEHTVVQYLANKPLLIASKKTVSNDETYEWEYTYTRDDLLMGIVLKHNGAYLDSEESYSFSAFDGVGNWTDSRQTLSSLIDWSHPDGIQFVRREITYMK